MMSKNVPLKRQLSRVGSKAREMHLVERKTEMVLSRVKVKARAE